MGVFIIKNAGPIAAKLAGTRTEMDDAANQVLRNARMIAATHRRTGKYMSGLKVLTVPSRLPSRVGFVKDRLVVADHPAVLSIEYGHMVRHKNARRVSWVPGQHIMGRAMAMTR